VLSFDAFVMPIAPCGPRFATYAQSGQKTRLKFNTAALAQAKSERLRTLASETAHRFASNPWVESRRRIPDNPALGQTFLSDNLRQARMPVERIIFGLNG
jgi:hypothetical protein